MWAVVPLKSPETAKSRLKQVLSARERERLFSVLARAVIDALAATPGIDRVAVVTASNSAAALAASCGAETIRARGDFGTARACAEAVAQLQQRRAESVLLIAGDLPLVSPAALAPLVELARAAPVVAVVPDRHRRGSNALLCAPPDAIPVCFGPGSLAQHLAAARQLGVVMHVVASGALELDIDDPHDLDELRRRVSRGGQRISDELRAWLYSQAALTAP